MTGTRTKGSDAFEQFLARALAGESRQGTRLVLGMLDQGSTVEQIITDVLSRTQDTVGQRWHENKCSVADEHLATAVTTSALEAVSDQDDARPAVGRVAVACAEGDWHSLPARMFCELLRGRGWNVWFLGASTPSDDLGAMLARKRPDALVVSCAMASSFAGVERLVDAAHEQHIPVLAGGRAFGNDETRAARLGADAWAGDVEAAAAVLLAWRVAPPSSLRRPVCPTGAVELSRSSMQLADQVLRALGANADSVGAVGGPLVGADERNVAHLRHELVLIVDHLAAALMVGDPDVFGDFADWLDEHRTVRGWSVPLLLDALAALAPLVAERHPDAAALLTSLASAPA